MDTFNLTRETETDTLECIYTARIEAWTFDDWTRDTTVHLNHRDLVSYASFNNKKNSHIEMIECGVWSGYSLFAKKQFSHFSRNNRIS